MHCCFPTKSTLALYSKLSRALARLSARSWLDRFLWRGVDVTTTFWGERNFERARAARRQMMVRIKATPRIMEATGWWYMLYVIPRPQARSAVHIFSTPELICNFELCSSISMAFDGLAVSWWSSRSEMRTRLLLLITRAIWRGKRSRVSTRETRGGLNGITAEVQKGAALFRSCKSSVRNLQIKLNQNVKNMPTFYSKTNLVQARNMPTPLLDSVSGTSSKSSRW